MTMSKCHGARNKNKMNHHINSGPWIISESICSGKMWVDGWPWRRRSDILGWFERAGWRLRSSRLVWLVGSSAGVPSQRQTRQAWKAPWNTSSSLFSCFAIPGKQVGSDISSSLAASCAFSITAFLKGDSTLEVCSRRLPCQPAYYEQGQWVICSMRLQCFFPLNPPPPQAHLWSTEEKRRRGAELLPLSP